jgi:hypothetical protein
MQLLNVLGLTAVMWAPRPWNYCLVVGGVVGLIAVSHYKTAQWNRINRERARADRAEYRRLL